MPNYKRIFFNGYSYFLTIKTYQNNPILIDNIELLRKSFKEAKSKYSFKIEAIVILPDHIHTIISPEKAEDYPHIVRTIKTYFSRHLDPKYYAHLFQSQSQKDNRYKPVWQRRYYEHTIRDEKDFNIRMDYIHFNPVKHSLVERAKDWEFSSFQKYVKLGHYDQEWYNISDDFDFE
jgi:putative transposase